jgi:hypothetical protein
MNKTLSHKKHCDSYKPHYYHTDSFRQVIFSLSCFIQASEGDRRGCATQTSNSSKFCSVAANHNKSLELIRFPVLSESMKAFSSVLCLLAFLASPVFAQSEFDSLKLKSFLRFEFIQQRKLSAIQSLEYRQIKSMPHSALTSSLVSWDWTRMVDSPTCRQLKNKFCVSI